ncbi:MAG: prepilin-type N-terminal cleavage/methylation domain-containing protein [Nitrospiraceae bacterium]|nr:MAG: prepilin-type N-terminal cleavage/methylation domain-containing protein [Nitrospiraceae bacterium]
MKNKGFTLLEIIIAVTILSLVAVIIGGAFRLGTRAWERGEKDTASTQRLRVLSSMLSQQIRSAYPYRMEIEDEDVVVFKGGPDSLLLVTANTDLPFGGFKWVKYSYRDGGLYYKEGFLPDKKLTDRIDGEGEAVDLEVGEFKFSYLYPEEDEWKESRDFEKDLPRAVMVKISAYEPFVVNLPMGLKKDDTEEDDAAL